MNPRGWAAIVAGRLAGASSRALRRGGGTAIAGAVAQGIDPALAGTLTRQLGHGCALVTGTNGKTTTARMLAQIAREAGLEPLANPSGSNLMRGVAAALLGETDVLGNIRETANRIGIFEVDEAVLPQATRELQPRAIIFTNLFRDQLDRYGEADAVVAIWQRALRDLPENSTLVLNADDPAISSLGDPAGASLGDASAGRALTYGIEDTSVAANELEHASDYRFCLSCGEELAYSANFYGHIGHWRCPGCDRARRTPDVRATAVELAAGEMAAERATRVGIATPAGELHIELPLAGLYNVENALAATAGAVSLGLPLDAIERALRSIQPAFGRQERFQLDGREVVVLLGKNPTGLNQVLRTITANGGGLHLLFFLNDGIADGRDISWIWDTDYELVAGQARSVVAAGTRADELALRLKYADLAVEPQVASGTAAALDAAIAQTPPGETLHVVPTYTAMLEVRELLAKRGKRRPFWEER
ncbi:MAG: DUF1727 domain-containing protein [Chloroflexi bacterium]|nr:DUF1727 domain-containing protein [Chloroflexota bacterium]